MCNRGTKVSFKKGMQEMESPETTYDELSFCRLQHPVSMPLLFILWERLRLRGPQSSLLYGRWMKCSLHGYQPVITGARARRTSLPVPTRVQPSRFVYGLAKSAASTRAQRAWFWSIHQSECPRSGEGHLQLLHSSLRGWGD